MLSKAIKTAIFGLLMAVGYAASASAEQATFNNPMQGPNRLDWCFSWGEGCGQQAADAWCQANGWADGAVDFSQAADIGASQPTRLLSTGAVCDQGFCDGFAHITCSRPGAQTFNAPMQGPNRLDWCYSWGEGCGQQAATAWCQAQGYAGGAIDFSQAPDIGAGQPTRLISTGAVCDQGFCDGFAYITCQP